MIHFTYPPTDRTLELLLLIFVGVMLVVLAVAILGLRWYIKTATKPEQHRQSWVEPKKRGMLITMTKDDPEWDGVERQSTTIPLHNEQLTEPSPNPADIVPVVTSVLFIQELEDELEKTQNLAEKRLKRARNLKKQLETPNNDQKLEEPKQAQFGPVTTKEPMTKGSFTWES